MSSTFYFNLPRRDVGGPGSQALRPLINYWISLHVSVLCALRPRSAAGRLNPLGDESYVSQGLKSLTPRLAKSFVLRVTSVRSYSNAVAAIRPSAVEMVNPFRFA